MNIYIDTNIYLDYYRMSEGTVISLTTLRDYIKKNRASAKLILPSQTEDEFFRRRNVTIKDALTKVSKIKDEFNKVLTTHHNQKDAEQVKKQLEKLYNEQKDYLQNEQSEINQTIRGLFKLAKQYKIDDCIFKKAHERAIKGNPPGKYGSIGDQIAWEILLDKCRNEDLFIISKDKDWSDEIDNIKIKMFLSREWKKISSKKIILYKTIGAFINAVTKEKVSEKIIEEETKTPLISRGISPNSLIINSGSFEPQIYASEPQIYTAEPYPWPIVITPEESQGNWQTFSGYPYTLDSWNITKKKEETDKKSEENQEGEGKK